ncbi:hypothetical protein J6590_046653 [Homalodisca vitripennis]|nr:hypothetical protein J6590_046653 [Homalodisca vitripennis]
MTGITAYFISTLCSLMDEKRRDSWDKYRPILISKTPSSYAPLVSEVDTKREVYFELLRSSSPTIYRKPELSLLQHQISDASHKRKRYLIGHPELFLDRQKSLSRISALGSTDALHYPPPQDTTIQHTAPLALMENVHFLSDAVSFRSLKLQSMDGLIIFSLAITVGKIEAGS